MNRSPVIWVLFATVLIAGASAVALHFTLPGGLPSLLKPGSAGEPYACPMVEDAEVRSNGPGKCPKCGMDLVPLSQTEHGGTAEAASVHPGRAEAPSGHAGHGGTEPANSGGPPASGVKGEAGKKVAAPAGKGKLLYYCPMHPKFQSDRPGDCQICGMKLVQQKGGTAPESG